MRLRRLVRGIVAGGLLTLLALGAALWSTTERVLHDRRFPARDTTLVVPRGASGAAVANLLARNGIVSSALALELVARLKGDQALMKAGEFRFSAHRTLPEVLQQVVSGGQQIAVWVTLPEGFTARQIARTVAAAGLGPSRAFDDVFRHQRLVLGDGARTANLEGYLFPDTYLVPVDATPAQVATLMTNRFREMLPPDAPILAKRLGMTLPQIVTLASLVEREAKADDERALMAGVYYNRLRRDMPLEVDATLEYTFAHHKDVITYADLARDTPYNTYKHAGLPPTPIANPGRASLLAAFHPAPSNYLYYVYAGNGHHAFSRTLAEHNANVARYLR